MTQHDEGASGMNRLDNQRGQTMVLIAALHGRLDGGGRGECSTSALGTERIAMLRRPPTQQPSRLHRNCQRATATATAMAVDYGDRNDGGVQRQRCRLLQRRSMTNDTVKVTAKKDAPAFLFATLRLQLTSRPARAPQARVGVHRIEHATQRRSEWTSSTRCCSASPCPASTRRPSSISRRPGQAPSA